MFTHFYCQECEAYNDILNEFCSNCNAESPDSISVDKQTIDGRGHYQAKVEISRGIYLLRGVLGVNRMTDDEKLFAKFYNEEKVLVKDMDSSQLRQHREELSKIAFEAKARLVAADDEIREKKSKDKTTKNWTISTENTQTSSDAIAAVKTRTARMSKMDKLRIDLRKSNIDEDTINEMIRNLERRATEKDVKAITFKSPSIETKIVTVKTGNESNGEAEIEVKQPFDSSKLKFGTK